MHKPAARNIIESSKHLFNTAPRFHFKILTVFSFCSAVACKASYKTARAIGRRTHIVKCYILYILNNFKCYLCSDWSGKVFICCRSVLCEMFMCVLKLCQWKMSQVHHIWYTERPQNSKQIRTISSSRLHNTTAQYVV